jgi:hypothetical protein
MSEDEYLAGEFTDAEIDALADGGDFHLEGKGYNCMPTQEEMQKMATEGEAMLLTQWVRQNLQKEQQK